ncbi:hypothetical protein NS277_08170 [Novosphingobium barchaimii]|nr:hypothetical protein NS277_08170 [Novosphingobium barchaimii]
MAGVIIKCPIDEALDIAHVLAVIIQRIGMVGRSHCLPIETIDTAAVAVNAIEDILAILQLSDSFFHIFAHAILSDQSDIPASGIIYGSKRRIALA